MAAKVKIEDSQVVWVVCRVHEDRNGLLSSVAIGNVCLTYQKAEEVVDNNKAVWPDGKWSIVCSNVRL